MYTKFIGDRQVFSECRTIELKGKFISNPTAKQIASAGWVLWEPPVVPPSPAVTPREGQVLEAVKRMLASSAAELTDEEALSVAALYEPWHDRIGQPVAVGERFWYDGDLYKALQAHVAQADWTPAACPALFTLVSLEEWPQWVRPINAETAYSNGAKVTFEDKHYISKLDGNVWSPTEYPAAWLFVE